jgi:hypothetical protein
LAGKLKFIVKDGFEIYTLIYGHIENPKKNPENPNKKKFFLNFRPKILKI